MFCDPNTCVFVERSRKFYREIGKLPVLLQLLKIQK